MMLKAQALAWCDVLRQRLRDDIEGAESGIECSQMTGSLFGDPGGCDSRAMLADRKEWAETLAMLHELEEGLGTLDDEWWNGPKMEKKPTVGDTGTLGFMFASMRDGDASVRRQQEASLEQWEREQQNEHWSRRKEAEAQRSNPGRKFRIRRSA